MERHKCKLCYKRFTSGKALGGHMRTHLATLPIPPKTPPPQLGERTESASSLSSSEEKEDRESDEKMLVYGLRENPKKSFRVVDPEFWDAGSIVQDRESETESVRNPTRRRSKRTGKMCVAEAENQELKKPKLGKPSSTQSMTELEPVSSVSNTSPEEDVALCLMMLSRDVWSSEDSEAMKLSQTRTCNKVSSSFQALGGHRTSQKKIKKCFEDHEGESKQLRNVPSKNKKDHSMDKTLTIVGSKNLHQKVHECPFCGRVFGSGQALGGHKRSHLLGSSTTASNSTKLGDSLTDPKTAKFGVCFIDLNLPAPMEDEAYSQQELSVCSL
ncbi:unnamed protein product [Ilex paraguariensis]|uniref:C2H2-type domain-containing protein n=1 Tax=Ilex paraguariensis TaxID=185542 RepID=A0ABC8TUR2_9AQUA